MKRKIGIVVGSAFIGLGTEAKDGNNTVGVVVEIPSKEIAQSSRDAADAVVSKVKGIFTKKKTELVTN